MNTRTKLFLTVSTLVFIGAGVVGTARADRALPSAMRTDAGVFDARPGVPGNPFASVFAPAPRLHAAARAPVAVAPASRPDPHWGPSEDATSPGA
ncbi:hypothetical protein V5F49_01315 [Xanthobacter sp. V3C-3]|uniref:hypothetical protein n=1 Tax=Xanthobacter lutulentifluminis TaxID=3119935 RepID=UPI003726C992